MSRWPQALIESWPGFAAVVSPDGRVEQLSRRGLQALGVRPSAVATIGQLSDLAGRLLPAGLPPELLAGLAESGSWSGSLDFADAESGRAAWDVQVCRDDDGSLLVTARDRREVAAREQAERDRTATEEYLARLGHELRTPLNAVMGFAQLLELEPLESDQRTSVEHVLIAGRFMASLLDDVLDLSRVRGGGVDLDVGAVPVLDVVRAIVDLVSPLAGSRGMRRYVEPAEPLVALADRTRLWQVLLNLVGNAVKYGREGGTLRVGVSPVVGGRVRIEVEDDGPGIDPDALTRIFNPFERGAAERGGVQGTGLGLALAKALTTAMGGELSAHSRLGAGTVMAIELDAVDADAVALAGEGDAGASRRTVVHVSGDPASQALVAQALRSRLAARTVSVGRAALAPDVVRHTQPALVVVDDDLPDGTGAELLHRLAGTPLTALIPAVVLTQDAADARVVLRLRAAGAQAVLTMPLDVRELLDVVGRFLDRAAAAQV